jgi:hypothetical protein
MKEQVACAAAHGPTGRMIAEILCRLGVAELTFCWQNPYRPPRFVRSMPR